MPNEAPKRLSLLLKAGRMIGRVLGRRSHREPPRRSKLPEAPHDLNSALTDAQSGEAALRLYAETHDAGALRLAIRLLRQGVQALPDSDANKIRFMLILTTAVAARFDADRDPTDFNEAIEWNDRALASDPPDEVKVNAFYGIGALHAELYKQTSELGGLEAAIDNFIEALQRSTHEHLLRQTLIGALQGMLAELTLKVPDPLKTGDRWDRAFRAVPFRSLDQKALKAAWHVAFGHLAQVNNPAPQKPTFLDTNRARLRAYAPANEAKQLREAAARTPEQIEIGSHTELRRSIDALRAQFPGALLVFSGQTAFHDGRLLPSMARKAARDVEETNLLWIAAIAENLQYGEPDQLTQMVRDMKAAIGLNAPSEEDETFWKETDLTGSVGQAILQHYGARTHFIDVSTSLEIALWFAHFKFRLRREVVGLDELTARGARWDEDDPAPEYDIAWYEPAWSETAPAWGYLFVVAPRLSSSGEHLVRGEYIDLTCCPSPRMRAQHAGLVYIDLQGKEQGEGTVAVFKFRLPLEGAPAEALDPSVTRLFPAPDKDPLYGRILWSTPFWPEPERPNIQVRRLRVPEYHSAPAARPSLESWGDWSPFRGRDRYTRPGFVFPRLAKSPWGNSCTFAGRAFELSKARPLVPSVPSMMIEVPVPEPDVQLDPLGQREVFLEYDPLSHTLSSRAANHHITAQPDRRSGFSGSWVPLPGVRGAWIIQFGDLFWCRVYTQGEDERFAATPGHAFGFDPQFGWIVKEGSPTDTAPEAIEMRAERAVFYLLGGVAEQVKANRWCVTATPGSPYFSVRLVR
jgi:tetratricopeptide (TPR) repeat protein